MDFKHVIVALVFVAVGIFIGARWAVPLIGKSAG